MNKSMIQITQMTEGYTISRIAISQNTGKEILFQEYVPTKAKLFKSFTKYLYLLDKHGTVEPIKE